MHDYPLQHKYRQFDEIIAINGTGRFEIETSGEVNGGNFVKNDGFLVSVLRNNYQCENDVKRIQQMTLNISNEIVSETMRQT